MSEVDRLSNSGLYPALPIADQRRDKGGSPGKAPDGKEESDPHPAEPGQPRRPPKSLIDEYA